MVASVLPTLYVPPMPAAVPPEVIHLQFHLQFHILQAELDGHVHFAAALRELARRALQS